MSVNLTNKNDDSKLLVESLLNATKASIDSLLMVASTSSQFKHIEDSLNRYIKLANQKAKSIQEDQEELSQVLAQTEKEETVSHEEVMAFIFNNNIKKVRITKKLTQVQLAHLLDKKPSEISRWESGGVTPSMKNMTLISKALGCSLEELIN